MQTENIGIIILAAGQSKRLGRPKQLLKFQHKTLIERIAETALETEFQTVVVLGANAEKMLPKIKNLPIKIVQNKNWQSGMSSSIVAGLERLLEMKNSLSAVVVLLCDQPFITKDTILKLVKTQRSTGKSIIASQYENTSGVPALFTKNVFDELLSLNAEIGAKSIIKKYSKKDLAGVTFPEARFDIDTEEDLKRVEGKI